MLVLAISLGLVAAAAGPAWAQGKTAAQLLEEYQQRQRELANRGNPSPPSPPSPPPVTRSGNCPPGSIMLLGVCSTPTR